MSDWLFLRGEWDARSQKSIQDDDDMWLQLFRELDDLGIIWLKRDNNINRLIDGKSILISNQEILLQANSPTHIFARGGFGYYLPILKAFPDAYKLRYGAGKRFMPEPDIDYQLILVDTEAQKQAVLEKYPDANVHLLIKPAARHFKPIECEKEYDVCYIANQQQARIKGTKWVYDTVPRDLRVLHLGYIDRHITPPPNITRKRVDRIDMPKWISKCTVGVVPYGGVDSCPRVIPEMMACGLPIIVLDSVNVDDNVYKLTRAVKSNFWEAVRDYLDEAKKYPEWGLGISGYYEKNLSISIAAQHIKDLIGE